MQPILKQILFKPFSGKDRTESGLYVPESFVKPLNKGTIVATGNKVTKVKAGEIAYRVKDWGEEVIMNGEKHYLMNEDAILALQ